MTEQGVLVLVALRPCCSKIASRPRATQLWRGGDGDRAVSADGQQPMAALVSPGQLPQVGDLQLETASGLVRRGTRPIGLTERESSLLLLLFKQRGKAVSRNQILREVWSDDQGVSSNVVEVYICYPRQKLEEGGDTRLIHTIRGRGYCLNKGVPFLKSS
ncbi:MAG: winged helix-turn-helix domain-containing protein [Synechococcus sp. ArSW.bin.68]